MLEESFKPMVIFFGLINFPAMFQTMMNKILQDLINTGKVVNFIDDIIVRKKEAKEHNKVVEKVVKRLAENDLYVKLEKVKMKEVLNWLTPKRVKGIQKFLGLANYYQWFIKDFTSITGLTII